MRIAMIRIALASLAGGILPMQFGPVFAQDAPAAKPAHYSVNATLVGTLLDDPAAATVLKNLIPSVYANEMFQQNGRTLTLKEVQQYEPDALSDANLAKIQAEFDKLPAKG